MVLGMEVGLSQGHIVLDGGPSRKRAEPRLSSHVYCVQMAAWIKTPHGKEVALGLRDIVLDGDPAAPPIKGHPQFLAMSVVAKRLGGLRCHLVLR